MIDWKEIKGERSRTYHYDTVPSFSFADVVRLAVGKSGTHRLELKSGKKVIVAPGWRWIEIDAENWSL